MSYTINVMDATNAQTDNQSTIDFFRYNIEYDVNTSTCIHQYQQTFHLQSCLFPQFSSSGQILVLQEMTQVSAVGIAMASCTDHKFISSKLSCSTSVFLPPWATIHQFLRDRQSPPAHYGISLNVLSYPSTCFHSHIIKQPTNRWHYSMEKC